MISIRNNWQQCQIMNYLLVILSPDMNYNMGVSIFWDSDNDIPLFLLSDKDIAGIQYQQIYLFWREIWILINLLSPSRPGWRHTTNYIVNSVTTDDSLYQHQIYFRKSQPSKSSCVEYYETLLSPVFNLLRRLNFIRSRERAGVYLTWQEMLLVQQESAGKNCVQHFIGDCGL